MRKITFVLVVFFLFTSNFPVFAAPVVMPVSVDTTSPVIGDLFSVTASVSGALAGNTYFLKCRIGANSSSLTDGQTYNSQTQKWLDDAGSTGAWIDMPQVSIGGDGTWRGTLQCRIKSGATDETKLLFMRACLNTNSSCGTSFQSNSSLALNPLVPTPTSTPTPTLTPVPTSIPTSSPTNTPTPSPTPQPQSSPTVRPSATPTKKSGVTPRVYDPDAEAVTPRQEPTGAVLGETTNSTDNNAKDKPTNNRQGISLLLLLLLIGGGVGCIAAAVVLSTKEIRRRRQFNL